MELWIHICDNFDADSNILQPNVVKENTKRRLNFDCAFYVDRIGSGGGVAGSWRKEFNCQISLMHLILLIWKLRIIVMVAGV